MSHLQEATIVGLNEFLDGQRKVEGQTRVHLIQFDHEYNYTHYFKDLDKVQALTAADYQPRGTTALLDAIGRTIDEVGTHLAGIPESQRPGKVIVVIQTDGAENASRDYSHARIQEMITHQRERYSWEFVFLGANQDAIATGTSLGVLAGASLSYNANVNSTRKTFGVLTRSVVDSYVGNTAYASFNAQDRKAVNVQDDSQDATPAPDLGVILTGTGGTSDQS